MAHRISFLLALMGCWWLAAPGSAAPPGRTAAPQVRVVTLPEIAQPFFPILAGPPDTASMESGLVTLDPGKSAGLHSTKGYEELLVPLAGEGELRIPGRHSIPIKSGCAVYSPPGTEHNVVNTGKTALTYIFVVAKVP